MKRLINDIMKQRDKDWKKQYMEEKNMEDGLKLEEELVLPDSLYEFMLVIDFTPPPSEPPKPNQHPRGMYPV